MSHVETLWGVLPSAKRPEGCAARGRPGNVWQARAAAKQLNFSATSGGRAQRARRALVRATLSVRASRLSTYMTTRRAVASRRDSRARGLTTLGSRQACTKFLIKSELAQTLSSLLGPRCDCRLITYRHRLIARVAPLLEQSEMTIQRIVDARRPSTLRLPCAHGPSRAAFLMLPAYVRKANERTTSWITPRQPLAIALGVT